MARKNYYVILGIPRSESAAGVRAAYRDLVKRHHPDVAGETGAARFRDIVEAYEVLSDPDQRRHYNHSLDEIESIPEAVIRQAPSIFDQPEGIRPSFEEMFDRFHRNFTGIRVPKAEHEEGLNIEVVLTPEEARRGGVLPVTFPVFETCPACGGTGMNWPFPCLECQSEGLVERRQAVRVRIPPLSRPREVIEFPLQGLGINNFYLRLHLLVGDH